MGLVGAVFYQAKAVDSATCIFQRTNNMAGTSELACVYAALILTDDQIDITADKINTILNAANVPVESYWPGLFAKALEGVDVKSLICNVGVGSGGGGAAAGAGAAADEAKEEVKEEAAKEESEEESDDDMGFGLFD